MAACANKYGPTCSPLCLKVTDSNVIQYKLKLRTVLAGKVMQSVMFVHSYVPLFSRYFLNLLTSDLDFSTCMGRDHSSRRIESQGHMSRCRVNVSSQSGLDP